MDSERDSDIATQSFADRAKIGALRDIAGELRLLREAWLSAPMQEINRRMLAQIERQEGSSIAAPTLVFPGGKPGSH
jgi:hypothetical protein